MWRLKLGRIIVSLSLLVILNVVASNADAQGLAGLSSSVNTVLGRTWGAVGGFLTQDLPGASNPAMPAILPPYFGGEFHIRPVFFDVTKAQAISSAGDVVTLNDLNSRSGSYLETMLRVQIGRFSVRGYYNVYLNPINSTNVSVNWLTWRLGADLDVIYWCGFRLGATYDIYPERPYVTINRPTNWPVTAGVDSFVICAKPPQTIGMVASFNPCNSCTVAPSIEFRYQWPIKQCSSGNCSGTQITQWEIAAGFMLPKTVLGQSGLRFGYRDTNLYSGCSDPVNGKRWAIDLSTSGYFGELVWLY